MPRPRAGRKPKVQWDNLKGRICALYADHTLQELIELLRAQDNFEVSKRQLVYRLNKWDCKKYNTGDGEDGQTPEPDDNAGSPDSISVHEIPGAHNEEKCATSHIILDEVIGGQGQVPWDINMANAQFAAGDNKSAWQTFQINPAGLQNLTALARSAQTQDQCNDTLQLLKQHIYNSEHPEQLYCCLLYIHVCDTMGHQIEEHVKVGVSINITCILDPGSGFLLRRDGSIDMVAYALLDSFNENYNHLLPEKEDEDLLADLLYDFEDCVGNRRDLVLRQCAQWCHQQLFGVSRNPDGHRRPNLQVVAGESQGPWKDHLEVFGTLWNILATQQQQHRTYGGGGGGIWPAWANRAARDLNLSHAELLSCVCWVVIEAGGGGHGGGDYDHDHPAESLFASARSAAHEVSHWSAATLWEAFRQAFMRLNRPTAAVREENSRFNALAMEEFRLFVQGTLVAVDLDWQMMFVGCNIPGDVFHGI